LHRKIASRNTVNRNNTKTIGKHRKVVEKPLYNGEGLMRVAALYHGTSELKFAKFGE